MKVTTAQSEKRLRAALLASSTIDLLQAPLDAALSERGIAAEFWTSGFGQYRQAILHPDSGLYRFRPDAVFLYLDGEDLFADVLENPYDPDPETRRELARARASEVASLASRMCGRLPEASVFLNTICFPPLNALTGLEYNSEYSLCDLAYNYNAALGAASRKNPAAAVVDVASLICWMGFQRWRDQRLWCLARSRWSREAVQALAARYAAALSARLGHARKCIVLDLDNTLWGGVAGEDGPEGVRLAEEGVGRAFAEFQAELLNLYRKGILLAICSKNNPEDALEIIRRHPSMRLREEHFAAVRINWEDKASNLRALAEELNIGLDSLVFIDDNPVERSWVREALPEVRVPDWPADPSDYAAALLAISVEHFYKFAITAEDRRRGELYMAQAERRKLAEGAASIEDFYRSLQMRITIGAADRFTIPRIAQLTQKTNQFNLTTRRYTEPEIAELSRSEDSLVLWLEVADRFGSNGIVGVMILRNGGNDRAAWNIDTFLLSCRVMGRTVEEAFLSQAAEIAKNRGAKRLIGEYRPTARNMPVADLYARLGFRPLENSEDRRMWEFDLERQGIAAPEWFDINFAKESMHAG